MSIRSSSKSRRFIFNTLFEFVFTSLPKLRAFIVYLIVEQPLKHTKETRRRRMRDGDVTTDASSDLII